MQTFLPYKSFAESAACLDNKRLGKQRVEVLQILKALHDPTYGWQNHPAVKMWRGHIPALGLYGIEICNEWFYNREFNDTCALQIASYFPCHSQVIMPDWLTDEFCLSHRSNLIRKNPEHYRKFWPDVPDNLPYIWPVN